MSKTVKIWLMTAAALVALGGILFAGVMANYEWDFTKLSTVTYVTNTYEAHGEFDEISIHVDTTDIEFVPTEDGDCRIVCFEAEKARHSVTVQNGSLTIKMRDTRNWYDHVCISLGSPKMTVYLPQKEYSALFIATDTGDIHIPKDFTFERIQIDGDTSEVDCFASVADLLEIELRTGDIHIDSITAEQVNLTTTTGEIAVNDATTKNGIDIKTDTGTITLKNVVAAGSLSVKSDTGDVRFEDSDAAQISIKTSTGDVTGTLLSEKVFITDSSTGRISVPKTTAGGKCEITTDTGDIRIDIAT